jgi:lysophospholipase L1-like esterase
MKKNRPVLLIILLISILLNIIIAVYFLYKIFITPSEKTISPKSQESYYLGLDKIFEKLPNDSNEIIFIGNSLTQYFKVGELFQDYNIKNRGISGDITKGILNRINEIVESSPEKIFIQIGINDLGKGYNIGEIICNYNAIISKIKNTSPNTRIYIQSLLPVRKENKFYNNINHKIIELNQQIKEIASREGLPYIDLHSKFVYKGELNPLYSFNDGLHLNGDGYLLWKKVVKEYVYE